jgi:type III secretory pathway component EscV
MTMRQMQEMLDALLAKKPTEQEVLDVTERIRNELEDALSISDKNSRAYAYADWLLQYIQERREQLLRQVSSPLSER